MSVLGQIIAGLAVAGILAGLAWAWRSTIGKPLRISVTMEEGPVSKELGFTETAVKITVSNKSNHEIVIQDARLMFCPRFGVSVPPKAPPGRSHRRLPVTLSSGAQESWYFPAEKLSSLLGSLYRPKLGRDRRKNKVKLRAQCVTGTEKAHRSSALLFSTDPNSHWP